jgi:hypothetical protein
VVTNSSSSASEDEMTGSSSVSLLVIVDVSTPDEGETSVVEGERELEWDDELA